MDDGWEDLGAVAARVVKGVALAGGGPASAAQAGTGETRRADDSGGGTAIVLEFRRRGTGATGPTWPPQPTIDTVSDDGTMPFNRHMITPATGGLGNARRAKT